MTNDQLIRDQLLQLLTGQNAHVTFEKAVATFPLDFANQKVENVFYSPWQLLEHIRIAQWDILEFIRNPDHESPSWPDNYWPKPQEKANEMRWQKTVSGIISDLAALQNIVKNPESDFYAPIPHAKDYTIFREILVVANHNSYHIGQFVLLRKALGIWR